MKTAEQGVVITGVGLSTPVGMHATQACASVRAGVNRFRRWPHFDGGPSASFFRQDLGDDPWTEKAAALLELPVAEALWEAGLSDLMEEGKRPSGGRPVRLSAFAAVPSPTRPGPSEARWSELSEELTEDLLPSALSAIELCAGDQVAGLLALAQASTALQKQSADVCLVMGVDSLLESKHLWSLAERGRLLQKDASTGLIPGEAGVALVVETEASARRRGVPVLAKVDALALEQGPAWREDLPIRGEALSGALRSVLAATQGAQDFHRVVSDLNGERWRFLEQALVETRCFGALPRGVQFWQPAQSLGDVGASFAPAAAVMAVRGFARGYAGAGRVLVMASAEQGARGALSLSPPGRT